MSGLQAKRVLVLRAEHQANELAEMLSARGAQPVMVPVIRILPAKNRSTIDDALKRLHDFQWAVFTSVNGVESILSRMQAGGKKRADGRPGLNIPTRVAAIGPATARALHAAGVVVDWMPGTYTSVAMGEELPGPPSKVLLIRAEVAPTDLEEILRRRGFEVERLNAYRTEATGAPGLVEVLHDLDAVTLTSAWIVRCFVEAAGPKLRHMDATVCSIGPATTRACHNHGIKVDVEASEHTLPGLVEALERYFY